MLKVIEILNFNKKYFQILKLFPFCPNPKQKPNQIHPIPKIDLKKKSHV